MSAVPRPNLPRGRRRAKVARTATAIPDVLPTSPLTLVCPLCKAKPGRDCATSSGGLSVVHVKRIKAAAAKGKARS
jgi:hypothetical protein